MHNSWRRHKNEPQFCQVLLRNSQLSKSKCFLKISQCSVEGRLGDLWHLMTLCCDAFLRQVITCSYTVLNEWSPPSGILKLRFRILKLTLDIFLGIQSHCDMMIRSNHTIQSWDCDYPQKVMGTCVPKTRPSWSNLETDRRLWLFH